MICRVAASAGGGSVTGAVSTASGAASATMWSSSAVPERGFSGTAGTPARIAATTATQVSIRFSAMIATQRASASDAASAADARSSSP